MRITLRYCTDTSQFFGTLDLSLHLTLELIPVAAPDHDLLILEDVGRVYTYVHGITVVCEVVCHRILLHTYIVTVLVSVTVIPTSSFLHLFHWFLLYA